MINSLVSEAFFVAAAAVVVAAAAVAAAVVAVVVFKFVFSLFSLGSTYPNCGRAHG